LACLAPAPCPVLADSSARCSAPPGGSGVCCPLPAQASPTPTWATPSVGPMRRPTGAPPPPPAGRVVTASMAPTSPATCGWPRMAATSWPGAAAPPSPSRSTSRPRISATGRCTARWVHHGPLGAPLRQTGLSVTSGAGACSVPESAGPVRGPWPNQLSQPAVGGTHGRPHTGSGCVIISPDSCRPMLVCPRGLLRGLWGVGCTATQLPCQGLHSLAVCTQHDACGAAACGGTQPLPLITHADLPT
jgi:hypothetical protein